MPKAILAVLIWVFAAATAVAQSSGDRGNRHFSLEKDHVGQRSVAPSRSVKSCAEFGAGFVRVEGSDTCVRLGGSIGIGVGGGSGRSGGIR